MSLGVLQGGQGIAEGRFAGPGLADQGNGFASADRQRHVIDRLDMADRMPQQAAADGEIDLHPLGDHECFRVLRQRRRRARGFGSEQFHGVGVLRPAKYFADRPGLDDTAMAHHGHTIGITADDGQVVADQQQRQAAARFLGGKEFQYLRLDGHIERRGRLIGDQELGVVGQRDGDHHALALPAGKLVRKRIQTMRRIRKADLLEQGDHPLAACVRCNATMQGDGLGNLRADAFERIEAGHRLLEHHARTAPPQPAQSLGRSLQHVRAIERNGARAARARGEQLQHRKRRE